MNRFWFKDLKTKTMRNGEKSEYGMIKEERIQFKHTVARKLALSLHMIPVWLGH